MFDLGICIIGAVVLAIVAMIGQKGRRRRLGVSLLFFSGVPAAPSLKSLEFLFPGRKTPPDADHREPHAAAPNPHAEAVLPAGIVERSEFDNPANPE